MEESRPESPADLVQLYATIGSVASGWSHLENATDVTIWRLANVEYSQGACLTAHISSMRNKLLCLLSLMNLLGYPEDYVKTVNVFSGKIDKISRKRNRVVHDPISCEPGKEPVAITITADRKLVYGLFGEKLLEYSQINREVADALSEYLDIDNSLKAFAEQLRQSLLEGT